MIIIGIDPGIKGGVAIICDKEPLLVFPMPVCKQGTKKNIDGKSFSILVDGATYDKDTYIFIEQVHSMPKQGVVSTFTFGKGYGKLLGVLECMGLETIEVRPQEWKKVILENTNKDKQAAIDYVKQKYPNVSLLPTKRSKVPSDGMADAICIADYGLQTIEKILNDRETS